MKCVVTGGAGGVGSYLVDRLLKEKHKVIAFDNLSLGKKEFIVHNLSNPDFTFVEGTALDVEMLKTILKGQDIVFHLAANPDILAGYNNTRYDLDNGTIATYNVLEAMRLTNVKKIVFTSSNVIYGEAKKLPTPEDYGPLLPISLYAASKLAAEALITAYSHNFKIQCWIFRFGNIIHSRLTHGILFDFYNKLRKNPNELEILGDGRQSKPYLEIEDCLNGILFGLKHSSDEVNLFNLSNDGSTSVMTIANTVIKGMNLKDVELKFTGGSRGWPGDVPTVRLDSTKLRKLGWKPKYTSNQAIEKAFKDIMSKINSASNI